MNTEQVTHEDPTKEQIKDGLMALLLCTASELEEYSCKLLDRYTDDVTRVYKAMRITAPAPASAQDNRDAARLDFVIENSAFIVWRGFDGSFRRCQLWTQDEDENFIVLSGPEDKYFATAREAIDASIEGGKQ